MQIAVIQIAIFKVSVFSPLVNSDNQPAAEVISLLQRVSRGISLPGRAGVSVVVVIYAL